MRNLQPWAYGVLKALGTFFIFAAPIALTAFPKAGDVTVSAIVYGIVSWLEHKYSA